VNPAKRGDHNEQRTNGDNNVSPPAFEGYLLQP
jgi:hypothetical protein